jgi:hypothetical protein
LPHVASDRRIHGLAVPTPPVVGSAPARRVCPTGAVTVLATHRIPCLYGLAGTKDRLGGDPNSRSGRTPRANAGLSPRDNSGLAMQMQFAHRHRPRDSVR